MNVIPAHLPRRRLAPLSRALLLAAALCAGPAWALSPPQAPAPASALLSGILTKSGIFGVLVINCELFRQDFAWGLGLVLLGSVTMVLGAVLAIFSINLKRTLACSSVSQMGFVVVGIGMQCLLGSHNSLAVRGTLLHMVNHV